MFNNIDLMDNNMFSGIFWNIEGYIDKYLFKYDARVCKEQYFRSGIIFLGKATISHRSSSIKLILHFSVSKQGIALLVFSLQHPTIGSQSRCTPSRKTPEDYGGNALTAYRFRR